MKAEISSPAKINLGLLITGRRADGYHTLDSIMQTIDWMDDLQIETLPGRGRLELRGNQPSIPWDEGNILHRTYQGLWERFKSLDSLRLTVNKRIPAGAGLGGGSANAAAFLLYLQRRFNLNIQETERVRLAVSLGADVPFLLQGGTARVRGIGELVEPLGDLNLPPFVALNPGIEVSTARVFSHFVLTNPESDSTMETFLSSADPSCLVNQLMPVTVRLYPQILAAEADMRQAGCEVVLMSGSGSTLLGFGSDPQTGPPDLAWLGKRHRLVRWCCGISRSQYHNRIGA
jgi:4-diphosphocytidyl-2-C-methyl-D-erythritol kinase